MDIFADLSGRVAAVLLRLAARGVLPPGVDVGASSAAPAPGDGPFDAVVDAALVHARAAAARGLDRRAFARLLAAEIASEPTVSEVEATERGFIAVTFRPDHLAAALAALLDGDLQVPAPPRAWPPGCSLAVARAMAVEDALAALDAAAGRDPGGPTRIGPVSVARSGDRPVPPGGAPGLREAREVSGAEALRFALASADPASALALDLDALADRWRGNPVFWVPYVHERCRAALRRATPRRPAGDPSPSACADDAAARRPGGREVRREPMVGPPAPSGPPAPRRCADLERPAGARDESDAARWDRRVLRAVLRTPRVISACASTRSARRLAIHLVEVADAVRVTPGTSTYQPQSRFVNEERRDCAGVRLGLVSASALVLESGLGILGLTASDEVL